MAGESIYGSIAELDISPREYYDLLRYFNDLVLKHIRGKIETAGITIPPFINFGFAGSHGRRESGSPESHPELIAVVDEGADPSFDYATFETALKEAVTEADAVTFAKLFIEWKKPHMPLGRFRGSGPWFPERVADMRPLNTSDPRQLDRIRALRERLLTEMTSLPAREMKHITGRASAARKTMEAGRNVIRKAERVHYDLSKRLVYYDPDAFQGSFKIGPLRFIQYGLFAEETKNVRRDPSEASAMSSLPAGIVPRLSMLHDDKRLNMSRESVSDVQHIYAFFLRLYHRSEENFRKYKDTDPARARVMDLNADQVLEIQSYIDTLKKIMGSLKIGPPRR